ncbi:hypothetical protein AMTR_s00101p00099000 [Amborella trichopoda]|uniref:Uncharacterized protein n=1 Tax=Amborella trichopoda TaxID=13333 RepID=W1NUT3_AMBTC|nr:hypothetical protein AMTR_s00101p00099000 [Amborella trichopoda]
MTTYADRSISLRYYAIETFWLERGDSNTNGGFVIFPKMKFGCGHLNRVSFGSPMGTSELLGMGDQALILHRPSGPTSSVQILLLFYKKTCELLGPWPCTGSQHHVSPTSLDLYLVHHRPHRH